MRTAFQRPGRRYGPRRLRAERRAERQAEGHAGGRPRTRRPRAAPGLRAQQPRSFVPCTTGSNPARCRTPKRLLDQAAPTAPNQVWVGDLTYLPKQGGGWL